MLSSPTSYHHHHHQLKSKTLISSEESRYNLAFDHHHHLPHHRRHLHEEQAAAAPSSPVEGPSSGSIYGRATRTAARDHSSSSSPSASRNMSSPEQQQYRHQQQHLYQRPSSSDGGSSTSRRDRERGRGEDYNGGDPLALEHQFSKRLPSSSSRGGSMTEAERALRERYLEEAVPSSLPPPPTLPHDRRWLPSQQFHQGSHPPPPPPPPPSALLSPESPEAADPHARASSLYSPSSRFFQSAYGKDKPPYPYMDPVAAAAAMTSYSSLYSPSAASSSYQQHRSRGRSYLDPLQHPGYYHPTSSSSTSRSSSSSCQPHSSTMSGSRVSHCVNSSVSSWSQSREGGRASGDYFASPLPPPPVPPSRPRSGTPPRHHSSSSYESSFKYRTGGVGNLPPGRSAAAAVAAAIGFPVSSSASAAPSSQSDLNLFAPPLAPGYAKRQHHHSRGSPQEDPPGGRDWRSTPSPLTPGGGTNTPVNLSSSSPPKSSSASPASSTTPSPFPVHFTFGSLIQLSTGDLKRVEDLNTDDFVHSAEHSDEVKISHSTVTYMEPSVASGSGTISFAVGKRKIKVRTCCSHKTDAYTNC